MARISGGGLIAWLGAGAAVGKQSRPARALLDETLATGFFGLNMVQKFFLEEAYGLKTDEWEATETFDLGWRSREYLWFMEFRVPGLTPTCTFD